MAFGVISDIMHGIPTNIKVIIAIAIFLNVGAALISGVLAVWNLTVVAGSNALNGCATVPDNCIPTIDGVYILGINFLDFWVLNALIFFPAIALFAIKWYSMLSGMMPK